MQKSKVVWSVTVYRVSTGKRFLGPRIIDAPSARLAEQKMEGWLVLEGFRFPWFIEVERHEIR